MGVAHISLSRCAICACAAREILFKDFCADKDPVGFHKISGTVVPKATLEMRKLKTLAAHEAYHLGKKGLILIGRQECHLKLNGDAAAEKLARAGEHRRFVTLCID